MWTTLFSVLLKFSTLNTLAVEGSVSHCSYVKTAWDKRLHWAGVGKIPPFLIIFQRILIETWQWKRNASALRLLYRDFFFEWYFAPSFLTSFEELLRSKWNANQFPSGDSQSMCPAGGGLACSKIPQSIGTHLLTRASSKEEGRGRGKKCRF